MTLNMKAQDEKVNGSIICRINALHRQLYVDHIRKVYANIYFVFKIIGISGYYPQMHYQFYIQEADYQYRLGILQKYIYSSQYNKLQCQ